MVRENFYEVVKDKNTLTMEHGSVSTFRPTEEQQVLFGMLSAVQDAIRALVKTHPNPQAIIKAFREEHEGTMASFSLPTLDAVPAKSYEAYRDFLRGIAPNADEWLAQ